MKRLKRLLRLLRLQRSTARLQRSQQQNLRMAEDLAKLHANYRSLLKMNKEGQLGITSLAVIRHMTVLLQLRDPASHQHGLRVARLAALLAHRMEIDRSYCAMLELAAPLHDIGMLALSSQSYSDGSDAHAFQRHTELGAAILASDDHILSIAAMIARAHHEHFDGSGYPDGLVGENIPLEARIVAVADHFDDLLHGLHGHPRMSAQEAFNEVFQHYGTRYDPKVVRALNLAMDEFMDGLRTAPAQPEKLMEAG
ncbi:MAG: HD domain-containing phosphohydrolase [Pseudomonadota bacterium]